MRRTILAGLFLAGTLNACATAAPATQAPGPTGGPDTQPSIAVPSVVLPSVAVPSIAVPSALFSFPSFNSDEDLAARFPASIAGSPLEVQTLRVADFLQFFEDDPEGRAEFEAFVTAVGVPAEAISIGFGSFTYEDSTEQLFAIRAAGADPARLQNSLLEFTRANQDDPASVQVTQANIGGKAASIVTTADETTTYVYGAGDVVWTFESGDTTLADQVMGAIP